MSDSPSDAPDLLAPLTFAPERPFHARLDSNASTLSTASEVSSLQNSPSSSREYLFPALCVSSVWVPGVDDLFFSPPVSKAYYPDFVLYPSVDQDMAAHAPPYFDSPANHSPKPVGLIQPKRTAFTHHG